MIYDVVIIGAGVTGAAVARELSRYKASVVVLEKGEDLCSGTTKANSAIVHAGYDAKPGSMMAKMNVRGNEMMGQIAEELDVPFRRNGSFVVCTNPDEKDGIQKLYDQGIQNGVKDMQILTGDEARAMEPNLSEDAVSVLYAPTAGIVCPFLLNIAYAENANVNGVEFRFNTEVEEITKAAPDANEQELLDDFGFPEKEVWHIRTSNGDYTARYIINAAGVYADKFHNMVSTRKIHITPRKGEYMLLDHSAGDFAVHTIFTQPTKMGKGVLVAPTIHGNIICGPTANDIEDKEGTETTAMGLEQVAAGVNKSMKNVPLRSVITSFAGLRAYEDGHDFILGPAEGAPTFIDCAGIESPGLSSAPAIGCYIADLMRDTMHLSNKRNWNGRRKGILDPSTLSIQERNELIKKQPAYGTIICRCESISEGQILDAIHRPLGARSLDGVKRRVRAGMGRCQAGFCSPRTMDILNRELGLPMEEITKSGGKSQIVFERTKGERE